MECSSCGQNRLREANQSSHHRSCVMSLAVPTFERHLAGFANKPGNGNTFFLPTGHDVS
jgi:hypothetical protein